MQRPIASFALAPSHLEHPLNTNMVLLSKEGDIEMHELRDTPKHSVWSSRGDVALGAGTQYRVFSSYSASEHIPEPWDLEARVEASQEKHQENGIRKAPTVPQQMHVSVRDSSLTATRLNQSRASSAAAIRKYSTEPSTVRGSVMSGSPGRPEIGQSEITAQGSDERRHSQADSDKKERIDLGRSVSRGRKRAPENVTFMIIKTDISMTIRTRVLEGYGLFNVSGSPAFA